MSTTTTKAPLFLLGVGFIGGSVLQSLIDSKQYDISALTRSEAQATRLKELGVKPIFGTLHDEELIAETTLKNDIIIHAATADDIPSVRAILAGLAKRPASSPRAHYIHTSGTGLLTGTDDNSFIFSDKRPKDIDALPDTASHRDVDLLIKNAVDSGKIGNARAAIILPPLIYGIGNGPFNNISIQIPTWVRTSLKDKNATQTPKAASIWNTIHVLNLVNAYRTLITKITTSPEPLPTLYYFAETNETTWEKIGDKIFSVLKSKGLVEGDAPVKQEHPDLEGIITISRSKAEWLEEWGWKKEEATKENVWDSVEGTIEKILTEEK